MLFLIGSAVAAGSEVVAGSTAAGSAHTLKKIREAYKTKAFEAHPDAGGSTDKMRKINEAYQLLKNLYRN